MPLKRAPSLAELQNFVSDLEKYKDVGPSGLRQYVDTFHSLMEDSAKGRNPLDGWSPEVRQWRGVHR